MPVLRSPRWAHGALAWLIFFVASHLVLVLFPGDDPTGDGPWGMRAYVIFNVVLISMSAAQRTHPSGSHIPRR